MFADDGINVYILCGWNVIIICQDRTPVKKSSQKRKEVTVEVEPAQQPKKNRQKSITSFIGRTTKKDIPIESPIVIIDDVETVILSSQEGRPVCPICAKELDIPLDDNVTLNRHLDECLNSGYCTEL